MSPSTFSGEQARISYAILFALTAVAAWTTLGPPMAERFAFRERLAELRAVHARSVAALVTASAVREDIERRAHAADALVLLEAETEALAAAGLQKRIKALVEAEEAVLVSSAFRRGGAESQPLTEIIVAVRLRCSVKNLVGILYGLEEHEPPLFVDSLSIQSRHRPGRQIKDPTEELDVELEVAGYMQSAGAGS